MLIHADSAMLILQDFRYLSRFFSVSSTRGLFSNGTILAVFKLIA